MTSIPRLSGILRKLFFAEANELAREQGVIQRERVFSGASLVQVFVFGWLKNPQAGPSYAGTLCWGVGPQAE